MALRGAENPHLDWDVLLDGDKHLVDLAQIGFHGGINDLRTVAYREADRRRITVQTHKKSPAHLEIKAAPFKPPCVCGARPGHMHHEDCPWRKAQVAARTAAQQSAPQDQAPTHPTAHSEIPAFSGDEELTEAEIEALLGPCTCGQAPTCAPTCARAGG